MPGDQILQDGAGPFRVAFGGKRVPAASRAVRRFSVDEYDRLVEQGFFSPDDQVELLEGLIVQKMPRNPVHEAAVARASNKFARFSWNTRIASQSARSLTCVRISTSSAGRISRV